MNVKGTTLRIRMEFVRERYGPDAPERLLAALSAEERAQVESALPGSWVPFALADAVDETIARVFAGGRIEVCRDIGSFSASKNLSSVYKMFVERAGGDPQQLMENLANLHRTLYDWGWTRAVAVGEGVCRLEGEYEGRGSRANCLTAVGFYSEALKRLGIEGAEVKEVACQTTGADLCAYEIRWSV